MIVERAKQISWIFRVRSTMGHERVGFLPRTKRWRAIVEEIGRFSDDPSTIAQLADNTLLNVRKRYLNLFQDAGVLAAFQYLISLSTSHLGQEARDGLPPLDLSQNPSTVRIVKNLTNWIDQNAASREYAELASRAAADAIVEWTRSKSTQGDLFDKELTASRIWSSASTNAGFCEVARSFFTHFTQHYLRYFLEREASTQLRTCENRELFTRNLNAHVDQVTNHAFETTKIMQSFAAGWFEKHARYSQPSEKAIQDFLSKAFNKIQEELHREASKYE